MNRRKFLLTVSGGLILAAGAHRILRHPDEALLPWQTAGTYTDPREQALSYAILAPNPHNRQPWLVELRDENKVVLYADPDRMLPATDPFNRQIVVGLGCFLELLDMAAAHLGFKTETDIFPEGSHPQQLDGRPVAEITFSADSSLQAEPLFDFVFDRRSLKEPYDTQRPVSSEYLSGLKRACRTDINCETTYQSDSVSRLRQITADALKVEFETPVTYQESVDLFRIGKKEIEQNPDGIDFSGPLFETMNLLGLFSREAALDRTSSAYQQGLDMVTGVAQTGMAYIWLITENNSRENQIIAGRNWLRINLATTEQGLGLQPMSQVLQEFPEMSNLYTEIHNWLAADGGTIQMLGRLGFGEAVAASPRWPLESRIMNS